MSEKTLEALISAIEEYYPVFRKYLKRKGEILGHKNGLPFYDLFAPIGELTREIPFEEGKKIVLDNFYNFSTKLGDFAKNAMDNEWIDVYPRDGKVGGAFCSTITSIKESRVMLNYGGNFTDVVTMAHELGHGYHGSVLKYETAINNEYPMPLAETASTFCETLLKTNMINTLSKDEALTVLAVSYTHLDVYKRQVPVREQDPKVRSTNFEEVCLGYNEEEAIEEANRCLGCKKPMCVTKCPVSVGIPEFIAQVKEGKFEEAAKVLNKYTALPSVCGRVCPQEVQCESKCVLGIKGEALSIGKLERFVGDWAREHNVDLSSKKESNGKKVAVIGSGDVYKRQV